MCSTNTVSSSEPSASATSVEATSAGLADDAPVRVDRNVESVIAQRSVPAMFAVGDTMQDERRLNAQAQKIIRRVESKLLGTDFPKERPPIAFPNDSATPTAAAAKKKAGGAAHDPNEPLDIATQVDLLIEEAQSHKNLCVLYSGWNPAW